MTEDTKPEGVGHIAVNKKPSAAAMLRSEEEHFKTFFKMKDMSFLHGYTRRVRNGNAETLRATTVVLRRGTGIATLTMSRCSVKDTWSRRQGRVNCMRNLLHRIGADGATEEQRDKAERSCVTVTTELLDGAFDETIFSAAVVISKRWDAAEKAAWDAQRTPKPEGDEIESAQ